MIKRGEEKGGKQANEIGTGEWEKERERQNGEIEENEERKEKGEERK